MIFEVKIEVPVGAGVMNFTKDTGAYSHHVFV
jgi:hypothetical protein